MPRELITFYCVELELQQEKEIRAHFLTVNRRCAAADETLFWIKPHWYSRRRMVAHLVGNYWQVVSGQTDKQILSEMGVRI